MKYYVTADIHGFYSQFIEALTNVGYFSDNEPHKLIICGDLFDRGCESLALQEFILDLMNKDEVILIKGNHEDLTLDCINEIKNYGLKGVSGHHIQNRTVETLLCLNRDVINEHNIKTNDIGYEFEKSDFIQKIIPSMVNYYETENYIFVHGWIPCEDIGNNREFSVYSYYVSNWRTLSDESWKKARWANGMYLWSLGVKEPNKTIVCGHWHTSYGHSKYEKDGKEFGKSSNFSPFIQDGIIALDACTAYSNKVNVIIVND